MDNKTIVYASTGPHNRPPSSTSPVGHSSSPAAQQRNSPPQQAVAIDSLQSIRESFHQRAISSKATNIILQSRSVGTQKQYAPYIKKWHDFCSKREVNSYNPPLNTVLDFLVSLHEQGLSYTTINTAGSALSAVILPTDNVNIGSHPIVSRFMKGIYKSNPPMPRYRTTWDVNQVLSYLSSLSKPTELSLKSLTLKLTMLIALVSAQRGQSLHMLDTQFMKEGDTFFEFALPEHIKQSRPEYKMPSVLLQAYPVDQSLCVFTHMKEYLQRTKSLRGSETELLLSHVKPHHRAWY